MYDEFDGIKLNNLLIVDSLNYCFKYKHKKIRDFAAFFIRDMASFSKSYSSDTVLILGDGRSEYRKAIYPEYKANRKSYTEEEREEFLEFLEEYNRALTLLPYKVIKFPDAEADDIAAYLVDKLSDNFDEIWLLSTDKDWDLLLKDNVHRFSYVTRKEYRLENFEEHYGYPQEFHISVKCLQGDSGDDIPGVPGIGAKRAYNLIKEYGSAYDIALSLPIEGAQKFVKELNTCRDLILRNYDLMDIPNTYNEALGKQNIQRIRQVIGEII